jgi:RNA polymerase sigma-70 factor (ECF subfamily)
MSQTSLLKRCNVVDTQIGAVGESKADEADFDIEAIFRAQYARIALVIARVVRDPSRAEELAVDVFVKLWRNRNAQGENPEGWLYRVAVRMSLDELRRKTRRTLYERMVGLVRRSPTPEEICAETQEQERVRFTLGIIEPRQAELLFLRSHGLSYEELSAALGLNPASVGTFLSRAQQNFRKEYNKRYGEKS